MYLEPCFSKPLIQTAILRFLWNFWNPYLVPLVWDWPIPYSSAERAFIELASTLETREDILQAKLMLEGAANLRPMLLQSLLEACGNIQTKRLFLWLARTIGHPWYKHIDISRINLGTGKRQVVSGGTLDAQFLITVPKEVQDGQQEPLF